MFEPRKSREVSQKLGFGDVIKANAKGKECTFCKKWVGFIEELIDRGVDDIADIFQIVRVF